MIEFSEASYVSLIYLSIHLKTILFLYLFLWFLYYCSISQSINWFFKPSISSCRSFLIFPPSINLLLSELLRDQGPFQLVLLQRCRLNYKFFFFFFFCVVAIAPPAGGMAVPTCVNSRFQTPDQV